MKQSKVASVLDFSQGFPGSSGHGSPQFNLKREREAG